MKNMIAYRKTTRLKTILSVIVSITFLIVWLPFLRAIFDGRSYHWGTEYFVFLIYGAGVNLDFIFVVIQLLFYAALMISFYWVKNRNIFYGMLSLWFLNVFGNLLFDIIMNGDTMFHGDTLGVHISITWIVVPLSVLALLMIVLVIREDLAEAEQSIGWNMRNRNLMFLILGPLPIQAVLFAIGEPHALTDEIGVIISILQCFLIPIFLRPRAQEMVNAVHA